MGKKILVTGGSGFIGGNFVHYILGQYPENEIWNLDLLTYAGENGKHKQIAGNERYHFVQADITDRIAIRELFRRERFDIVVHFAAESHVDRSIADPGVFIQTNVSGTQCLLDAAMQTDVSRFVHVSTDEVYGTLDYDSGVLFTENTPLAPNSPYSASKASSDLLVRAYYHTYGLPVTITRCSNNYGPYQFPEKLIPLALNRLLNRKRVPVYGDGRNIRDWLHVSDHCRAIDVVMHSADAVGETYNIGANQEKTNLEVVQAIIGALDLRDPDEWIKFVPDRPGHDLRYAIDAAKLKRLGWQPRFTFNEGIRQTVDWYREHSSWWKTLVK